VAEGEKGLYDHMDDRVGRHLVAGLTAKKKLHTTPNFRVQAEGASRDGPIKTWSFCII